MPSGMVTPAAPVSAPREAARRAFTVVELMVVVVIIMVLASLTLSGLAVARQRVRIARTKSTIRKLHEIVVPHYESYLRRRVPFTVVSSATTNARNRLLNVRLLTVCEMPDTMGDVFASGSSALALTSGSPFLRTGPVLSYANARASGTTWESTNESAECLYMIVARGGIEPDLMEQFRADEIGDVDRDRWPEFLDGWGQPIVFLRWAPGFSPLSPVQIANETTHHDPFDPLRVDLRGYALMPLIVSGGPDRSVGLQPSIVWSGTNLAQVVVSGSTVGAPTATTAHRDNITNHDLTVK
jgi:Tfp pilus assembly protein PilE